MFPVSEKPSVWMKKKFLQSPRDSKKGRRIIYLLFTLECIRNWQTGSVTQFSQTRAATFGNSIHMHGQVFIPAWMGIEMLAEGIGRKVRRLGIIFLFSAVTRIALSLFFWLAILIVQKLSNLVACTWWERCQFYLTVCPMPRDLSLPGIFHISWLATFDPTEQVTFLEPFD